MDPIVGNLYADNAVSGSRTARQSLRVVDVRLDEVIKDIERVTTRVRHDSGVFDALKLDVGVEGASLRVEAGRVVWSLILDVGSRWCDTEWAKCWWYENVGVGVPVGEWPSAQIEAVVLPLHVLSSWHMC